MSWRRLNKLPCKVTPQPDNCIPCNDINNALDCCCTIITKVFDEKSKLLEPLKRMAPKIPPRKT